LKLIVYIFLTVATLAAFWQVNYCDFINYDDNTYVTENNNIQKGLTLDGIRWAMTTGYESYWHPLTWMSHMLDIQLFGLNPRGHHLTNLLFHTANTLLLFFVLSRMTRALWQSAFVAALFALHPLHVESVAWVAERKDVLSAFFWMLTMAAYVHYAERPGLRRYLTVLLLFLFGLMAKPMVITLPFVLLLLDYWPLRRTEKIISLLREKIPLFALAALSGVVTFANQQDVGAMMTVGALPLPARISNAFVSYAAYIWKMLWPDNLAFFYPHSAQLQFWQTAGAVLIFMAITFMTVRAAARFRYLIVGWLWYVGTLVPVIGIIQVGGQARADRYTYIPLIGLFIMVAWAVPAILKKWRYRAKALIAASTAVLSCLFIATWTQVGYWEDNFTLYGHAIKVMDNNYHAHYNRGIAFCNLGSYREAIEDFDRAIEIGPSQVDPYMNRGVAFAAIGNLEKAIEDFVRALRINPEYTLAYFNRGIAYAALGNQQEAIKDYDKAIETDPNNAFAYTERGNAYAALGAQEQAIRNYDKAIEIHPGDALAYFNRAVSYKRLGNSSKTNEDLTAAARLGHKAARDILRDQTIGMLSTP